MQMINNFLVQYEKIYLDYYYKSIPLMHTFFVFLSLIFVFKFCQIFKIIFRFLVNNRDIYPLFIQEASRNNKNIKF
jgi:hypothetical protein